MRKRNPTSYLVVLGDAIQSRHDDEAEAFRSATEISKQNRGLFGGASWVRVMQVDDYEKREIGCVEIKARQMDYCQPARLKRLLNPW